MPLGAVGAPRVAVSSAIPRIIHQTYPTRELPDEFRDARDVVQAMNPAWEYRFYDDAAIDAFIAREYPVQVLECYRRIAPVYGAARVDLFRYLLMFRCGGVYLDIKTKMLTPLDAVLRDDDEFVSAHWDHDPAGPYASFGRHPELAWHARGELQQWHIITRPGHPFLEAVVRRVLWNLEHYNPFRFGVGKMGVIRLTGPIPYTEAIVPLLSEQPHRILNSESELGLQYSIFSDGGQHKAMFRSHYSQLLVPIVPVRGVVERPFSALMTVKRMVSRSQECVYRAWHLLRHRAQPDAPSL